MRAEGKTGDEIKRTGAYRGFGIRDGHGIMFVSDTGDICPAGFLPLVAGNVRRDRVADIYRNSPCSGSCTIRPSSKAAAATANIIPSAAVLAPGPLARRAIRYRGSVLRL